MAQNLTNCRSLAAHQNPRSRIQPVSCRRVLLVLEAHQPDPAKLFEDHPGDDFRCAGFDEIDADFLGGLAPDIVVSPLFTRRFDCIDLAQRLGALDFRGAYRAISPALPSPDLIRKEIRALCPRLHFDLTFIDAA